MYTAHPTYLAFTVILRYTPVLTLSRTPSGKYASIYTAGYSALTVQVFKVLNRILLEILLLSFRLPKTRIHNLPCKRFIKRR